MRSIKFAINALLIFLAVAAVAVTLTCLGGPGSTSQNTLSGGVNILSPEDSRTAGDSIFVRFQSDQYSQIDSFTIVFGDSGTRTLYLHDLGDSGAAWISHVYSAPGRYNISALISSAGTGTTTTKPMEIAIRTKPPVVDSVVSGNSGCTIYWKAVAGAVSYNVYYAAGPTTDKAAGSKIPGVSSPCLVDSLTNDTQYAFAVSAVSAGGESGLSAVFAATPGVRKKFALTIITVNGSITRSPSQLSYDSGAVVTLTPVPAAGYMFSGWSGDLTGTANPGTITMTGAKTVAANFALMPIGSFALTVSGTNGTVIKSPNLSSYDSGTVVTLTPVPAAGYMFSGWNGDLTGTANPGSITMTGVKMVTADFTLIPAGTFALTVSGTNGTVTRSPSLSSYDSGTVVTLTPVPAAGYVFSGWSGDLTGTANPGTITMTGAKTVTVAFTIKTYTLTVSATNGTVTKSPSQSTYDSGTVVTLTPVPAAGYMFTGWSGDLTGTANPGTITMTGSKTITAAFAKVTFTLAVSGVNGTVTRSPDQTAYDSGTTVMLTPVPAAGYLFLGWSGALSGTDNPATITMTGSKSVTANFVKAKYTLTVSGTNGTVNIIPNQTTFDSGSVVTITAVPDVGYKFAGWSGDWSGMENPDTIIITGNKTITPMFKKAITLTILRTNGYVTTLPSQVSYDSGTIVAMYPFPDPGYRFSNWSGDLTGTADPGYITMNVSKTVTANFVLKTYVLNVSGTNGSVTVSPDRLAYDSGTVVTLTPVPAAGYRFSRWSGALTDSNSPATVVMTGTKSVTALFAPLPFTITFDKNDANANGTTVQQTIMCGSSANLTPNGFFKVGWGFAGWATSPTGNVVYANNASYTMGTANVILYAKWRALMVKILSAGQSFQMGQTGVAEPVHQVTFSQNLWMDITQVTQAEFYALMGYNNSNFSGADNPVESVTWFDAVLYCNKRSKRDGLDTVYSYGSATYGKGCTGLTSLAINFAKNGYRLPSEAEWEYACRGGATTVYWWGPDTNGMGDRVWSGVNSGSTTHPVATKLGNPYGLYDMNGNVWQWCNDWYDGYSATPVTDPTGPATGSFRVLRGGSYQEKDDSGYYLSANRMMFCNPDCNYAIYGFRCVLPAP